MWLNAMNGSDERRGGNDEQAAAGSEAAASTAASAAASASASSVPPAAPPAAQLAAPPTTPGAGSLAGIWTLLFDGGYLPGASWNLDPVCRQSAYELSSFRSYGT